MTEDQRTLDDVLAARQPILVPCPFCHGRGIDGDLDPWHPDANPCPRCQGNGEIDVNPDTAPIPF